MKFSEKYFFLVPVKFYNGYGYFDQLGSLVENTGTNFLLVTGKYSMKKLGYTKLATNQLKAKGKKVFLFDEVTADADTSTVNNGTRLALEKGCDAVVGLGGGSVIDTAKGIAVIAGNGGKIWDYTSGKKDASAALPIIAIPTTAGSGSEGNRYFVINNKEKKIKKVLTTEYTYPAISILDAKLTESLPETILAGTALDALGHSFEAYISLEENSFARLLALNSIWIIFNYLPEVLKNNKDRESRSALLLAATLGGIAINFGGVGAAHIIARALGGLYDLASNRATGIILPYTIEEARPLIDCKLSFLAKFLGWSSKENITSNADLVVEKLYSFTKDIGSPQKLGEIGINEENIPEIVDKILEDKDLKKDSGFYNKNELRKFLEKIIQ